MQQGPSDDAPPRATRSAWAGLRHRLLAAALRVNRRLRRGWGAQDSPSAATCSDPSHRRRSSIDEQFEFCKVKNKDGSVMRNAYGRALWKYKHRSSGELVDKVPRVGDDGVECNPSPENHLVFPTETGDLPRAIATAIDAMPRADRPAFLRVEADSDAKRWITPRAAPCTASAPLPRPCPRPAGRLRKNPRPLSGARRQRYCAP